MRAADGLEEGCCRIMQHMSTILNYLGLQIASHKTQQPTKALGTWSGSIVESDDNGVGVTATQVHWDKTIGILKTLASWLDQDEQLPEKD